MAVLLCYYYCRGKNKTKIIRQNYVCKLDNAQKAILDNGIRGEVVGGGRGGREGRGKMGRRWEDKERKVKAIDK